MLILAHIKGGEEGGFRLPSVHFTGAKHYIIIQYKSCVIKNGGV